MVTQPLVEERGYSGMYASLALFQLVLAGLFVAGSVVAGERGRRHGRA
jgi:hypothetical protein